MLKRPSVQAWATAVIWGLLTLVLGTNQGSALSLATLWYQGYQEAELDPSEATQSLHQRPEWAILGERQVGDDTYCVLESEPHLSQAGARREWMQMVRGYLREQAEAIAPEFPTGYENSFSDKYILDHLVPAGNFTVMQIQNDLAVAASTQPGQHQVAYVAIGEIQTGTEFRQSVLQMIRESQVRGRLGLFGLGYAGVFSTLALAVVYLKIDTATRHHYSRRLLVFAFGFWIVLSSLSWLLFSRLIGP